ncbi:MAG: NuoM family protein [Candidatus Methanoperedens sp.]|nr:NuoM family protein [Candidatus Methanoperedens sp.]MCZ7360544.1 NuoM family protein [Candidatus Methanoperedens sp.]HLB71061.1 NuoM family protein [Candidatus Methanoperedens sp.]
MAALISLMILIPLIGAIITFLTKTRQQARAVALLSSGISLLISLFLFLSFDSASSSIQFFESYQWIGSLGISLKFGLDGIGMPLVLLSNIVIPLTVLFAWGETKQANQFYGLILLELVGVLGVFSSLDFFVFYIFWEIVLIPMYFLISIWGGPRKDYSAIKFFIYTHVASLVMLLAIFSLYFNAWQISGKPNFDMFYLLENYSLLDGWLLKGIITVKDAIFVALLFGFIVKMPAVPFHTWLPDAHVEAPTAGSVILAALLLKMGGYGLFRVILPILPNSDSPEILITLMAIIGIVSILYGTFLALAQRDLKKMVAYSSIAHMGYVTLGAAALIPLSVSGAMFQQFSHGLITGVLFMSCGVIQHGAGTRIIGDLGGIAKHMPKLAFLMMAGFLASLGLPGMSGFIAEFLVLVNSYFTLPTFVILALFGIVFTAGYHLWAMQRAVFGTFNEKLGHIHDGANYEIASMAVLILLIIFFGLNPNSVLNMMTTNAEHLVRFVALRGVIT